MKLNLALLSRLATDVPMLRPETLQLWLEHPFDIENSDAVKAFMLAAEKEAARKKAEAEAWEATRKAQEAARLADVANIDVQREAAAAMAEAEEKQRQAQTAAKDTVKGLRTVHRYAIDDHRAALHWIAKNDRDAMTAFVEAYVAKNFRTATIDGVTVTQAKEAF
jgi:hypothetical protein